MQLRICNKAYKWSVVCLLALAASACGGGGTSNSSEAGPSPLAPTGAYAAWRSLLDGGRTVVVSNTGFWPSGNGGQDTLELTFVYGAKERTQSPLDAANIWRTRRTTTLRYLSSPTTVKDEGWIDFYFDDDYRLVAHVASNEPCSGVVGAALPPERVVVGGSGTLGDPDFSRRCSTSSTPPTSGLRGRWHISTLETSTPFFCWTVGSASANGSEFYGADLCFEVSFSGAILGGARYVIYDSGLIIFRNYTPR
jgi:hypothetical protein